MDQKEQELLEQVKNIQAASAQDKSADVSALLDKAINSINQDFLSVKLKRTAYALSFLFPPFGLGFSIYFLLTKKVDRVRAAVICAILTAVSIAAVLILFNFIFSSSGLSVEQLKQSQSDLQQLIQ